MRDELDLIPVVKRDVYVYSATVGLSTLVGAMLPLVPYFFLSVHVALYSSLILASLILAMVGVYKARLMLGNPIKSAVQMVLIGMGAAIAGYLIGLIFKV